MAFARLWSLTPRFLSNNLRSHTEELNEGFYTQAQSNVTSVQKKKGTNWWMLPPSFRMRLLEMFIKKKITFLSGLHQGRPLTFLKFINNAL